MAMINKINMVSGETYCLSELFSGNRKIIIPDLQRDYCWGDKIHTEEKKELVGGFINNLIDLYKEKKNNYGVKQNIGLIYGYEEPENYVQLCDGQQRITTLYLLVGMLNKYSGDNMFRHYLISDYEYKHEGEPYLMYAIRESSIYFMGDLVCNFFIHGDRHQEYYVEKLDDLATSSNHWYFGEYSLDPSIKSMLSALKIIEEKLSTYKDDVEWICGFGDFVLNRLTFLYYDVENRENGEETFVVINTTGEPLSSAQNLKPLVLSQYRDFHVEENMPNAEVWEKMETWFWKNSIEENGNDTADAGLYEFLRWVVMLHCAKMGRKDDMKKILSTGSYSFPVEDIMLNDIYEYWKIVKALFESEKFNLDKNFLSPKELEVARGKNKRRVISQISCFVLLQLIAYCREHKVDDVDECAQLYSFYNFAYNLTRLDNVGKNVNDLVCEMIDIATKCTDILDMLDMSGISETILTEEETIRLQILKDNSAIRCDIEKEFWQVLSYPRSNLDASFLPAQCHEIWKGEIMPLLKWSIGADGKFDFDSFKKYSKLFDAVFAGNCGANIDNVRRALLAFGIDKYPRCFRGSTNLSFGWEYADWHILINDNIDKFKAFFDQFDDENHIKTLYKIISTGNDINGWVMAFVSNPKLLTKCGQKNIQKPNNLFTILLQRSRMSGVYWIMVGNELLQDLGGGFSNWRMWGKECAYCDHNDYDVAIDILPTESEAKCQLRVFNRNNNSGKKFFDVKSMSEKMGFSVKDDGRFYSNWLSLNEVKRILNEIVENIKQQGVVA